MPVTCDRSVVFFGYSSFLCHDIIEILLKVALNTINQSNYTFELSHGHLQTTTLNEQCKLLPVVFNFQICLGSNLENSYMSLCVNIVNNNRDIYIYIYIYYYYLHKYLIPLLCQIICIWNVDCHHILCFCAYFRLFLCLLPGVLYILFNINLSISNMIDYIGHWILPFSNLKKLCM